MIAAFVLGSGTQVLAEGLYVIANTGVNIEPAAIKDVFLGETQFSGSIKLDVTDNVAAQSVFLSKDMGGIDKAKYDNLWVKKSFRDGVNQPTARGSDAEVIDFVKNTPGAIGYIISAPPAGVKVIQKY